jgi:hypothetical protein
MSNYKIKIIAGTLFLWTATMLSTSADTGTIADQPGSVNDPVITKSYFEQNLKKAISEELSKQLKTDPSLLNESKPGLVPSTTPDGKDSNLVSLSVTKLEPGQTLFGGAGSEIIVRTGKVTVTSSDENGIPDVTAGKDIQAGATVELNHLLVMPRDGRGIKSDPKVKQEIYVMVRGSYLITNADGSKAAP